MCSPHKINSQTKNKTMLILFTFKRNEERNQSKSNRPLFEHLSRASPIPLSTLLGPEVICRLGSLLGILDKRHLKDITDSTLHTLPHAPRPRATPIQGAHPRLHIVLQLQGTTLQSTDLTPRCSNLVLGPLIGQLEDSRGSAGGIGELGVWRSIAFATGVLVGFTRMDVGVFVPGLGRGGDDGVPDDCFRGRRVWVFGREGCGHVDEELFCVPGK